MHSGIQASVETFSFKEAASKNSRISVQCIIESLEKKDYSATASDGFSIAVLKLDEDSFKTAKAGEFFRIFGRAFKENDKVLINVEAIQSFEKRISESLVNVKKIEEKFGVLLNG